MAGWDDPAHRLDARRLEELFRALDWQVGLIVAPGTAPVDLLVCGGAAMCYQIESRGTGDVDIMFPPLPPDNAFLLGMKLNAARAVDTADVVWLMNETDTRSVKELHGAADVVSRSVGRRWKPTWRQRRYIRARARQFRLMAHRFR